MIREEIVEAHASTYIPAIKKTHCILNRTVVYAISLMPKVIFTDAYNFDGSIRRHIFGVCYHEDKGVPIYD